MTRRTGRQPLSTSIIRDPFTTLWPQRYGHKAFYVKVPGYAPIRVYKMKYLFSSVGGSFIMIFYVSRSHLQKSARIWSDDGRSFGASPGSDEGLKIIQNLKKYGCCRIYH